MCSSISTTQTHTYLRFSPKLNLSDDDRRYVSAKIFETTAAKISWFAPTESDVVIEFR